MMGNDTCAKRKFHLKVRPWKRTVKGRSPQHGMTEPEGPEIRGPEEGEEDR